MSINCNLVDTELVKVLLQDCLLMDYHTLAKKLSDIHIYCCTTNFLQYEFQKVHVFIKYP